MHYICKICNSKSSEKITTYKHVWYSCNDCGNTFSFKRENYPLSSFIFSFPIKLLNKIAFNKLMFLEKDYLKNQEAIDDPSSFYSGYSDLLKNNHSSLKVYDEGYRELSARLAEEDIKFENKSVLIISGGPGIVANHISKVAKSVLVTEFSDVSCKAMTEHLGLEAVKYDMNNDDLSEVVKNQTFDIVIAISVVGFCLDLEKFSLSLSKVLDKDSGIIYINHGSPTLGQMLFYQFDEYTPLVMQQKQTFIRILSEGANLSKIQEYKNEYNLYLFRVLSSGWRSMILYSFRTVFWIYYGLVLLLPNKNINRQLVGKGFTYIFRKK